MTQDKHYWKSLEERAAGAAIDAPEFATEIPTKEEAGWDRRSFLKLAGFSLAATAAACQRSVVEKAIPYLQQPEEIVPGKPYWLASTCGGCQAACGLLVKCRDGRPIKIEGNPQHPITKGGVCAIGQASVLELYDALRHKQPLANGAASTWSSVDAQIKAKLAGVRQSGGAVRVLTSSIASPTARRELNRFTSQFADAKVVSYDSLSASAILDAHAITHGVRALPRYRFDEADVILSLDADFLGAWISPVEFTKGYSSRRKVDSKAPRMSWHVQFEPRLSLTGSNADERYRVHPYDTGILLDYFLARTSEGAHPVRPTTSAQEARLAHLEHVANLDAIARGLREHRGRVLVVSGSQNLDDQIAVNRLNEALGAYGVTVRLDQPSHQRQGDDAALAALRDELASGKVAALFVHGVNPLYELPDAAKLEADMKRVPLVVTFAQHADETSRVAHYVCPEPHYLEAWNDSEAVDGVLTVAQPAIPQLGATRTFIESLAAWSGAPKSAYDLIRECWNEEIFPRQQKAADFTAFWDQTLHDGYALVEGGHSVRPTAAAPVVRADNMSALQQDGLALVVFPSIAMLDGRHANNAWLHEMPDPITKATWDNYALLSPMTAKRIGVADGDVVKIAKGATSIELPAVIQPGQFDDVVAIPLGYGRSGTERFTQTGPKWLLRRDVFGKGPIGRNAAPFIEATSDRLSYVTSGVEITKTGRTYPLALTQMHHTLTVPENLAPEGKAKRNAVQETTLIALAKDSHAGTAEIHAPEADMWGAHASKGHRWAMAIDLTACTGCSGCVISCQAENNVPVVGKDEVLRQREMHWIRLDRYYSGDDDRIDVVHQPMMCSHCENASCESVCPVLATVHSTEGLNQQVYNRCVGTRYCANNCAYKARRFNWFDYPREDKLQNMVLNPDVAVRSRGVMEKCSMCVQRIEYAKIEAKRNGVALKDGDIKLACQQSCPADAIVFGDINDPKSEIAKVRRDGRHYLVLEEINLKPSVGYLRLVRNRDERKEEPKHV